MTGDFAADARLLEDVHRLQEQRLGDAEIGYQLFDCRRARELIKHRIKVVQRVADLINRLLLGPP